MVHPAWASGNAMSQGVVATGSLWLPLHIALLIAHALLWLSAPTNRVARTALLEFVLANTAFLAIGGLVVGVRAPTHSTPVDAVWSSAKDALRTFMKRK